MKAKKIYSYLFASVLFTNPIINSIAVSNNEYVDEESQIVKYEKISIETLIEELEKNIQEYELLNDVEILKEIIIMVGNFPKKAINLQNNDVDTFDKINYIFSKVKIYCYNLNTDELRETYVQNLAESVFLGWKYNKKITYYKDTFLLDGLVKYNKDLLPKIQSRLDYLEYVAKVFEMSGDANPYNDLIPNITMPEEDSPDKEYDDIIKDDITEDYDDANNNGVPNKPDLDGGPNVDGMVGSGADDSLINNSSSSVYTVNRFEKQGSNCYKVKDTYSGGKLVKSDKTPASKSEYIHCGIYSYFNFGSSTVNPNIEIDTDHIYQNQNEDSSLYMYYTVTNNNKKPYYFSSGIRVEKDNMSLSYNQAIDILYQIAIKEEGFIIKDNFKSLFIIDGKPIVLNEEKLNTYSETYINNLLKSYPNISVKIMDEESYSVLVDDYNASLNKNYVSSILINDAEFMEDKIAWIEDDKIKASINKLAVGLKANIKKSKDLLIISKGKNEIELMNNKKECYINGQLTELSSEVYILNGSYIVDLEVVLNALNYTMDFDINDKILTISNK